MTSDFTKRILAAARNLTPQQREAIEAKRIADREAYHRELRRRMGCGEERLPDLSTLLPRLGADDLHIRRILSGRLEDRPALQAARAWRAQLRKPDARPFLALMGKPNAGKSFAATWALSEWAKGYPWNGQASGAVSWEPALFARVATLVNKVFDDGWREEAKRAHFVGLEDLGGEALTPQAEALLLEVLDVRYAKGKATVITSNLTLEGFDARFDARHPGADVGRLGRRLRERGLILDGNALLAGTAIVQRFPAVRLVQREVKP